MYDFDISISEVLSIIDSVRDYLNGDDLIPEREQERGCPDEVMMIFDRIVQLVKDEKAKAEDVGYDAGDANGYHEGYLNGVHNGWEEGYRSGLSDGYDDGYIDGESDGFIEGCFA